MRSTTTEIGLDGGAPYFVKNRLLVILAGVIVWTISYFYYPYSQEGFVVCPCHGLLGLPCSGCGMTRAFCAMSHFHFLDAVRFNVLSLLVAVLLTVAPIVAAMELLYRKRFRFYKFMFSMKLAGVLAAVVIVFTVGRIAVMVCSGVLVREYVATSWTYQLLQKIVAAGG